MDDRTILDAPQRSETMEYAGFWLRFAAILIDGLILAIPVYALQFLMLGSLYLDGQEVMDQIERGTGGGMAIRLGAYYVMSLVIYWLYFALQESSPKQATLGKRAVHIKVIDYEGEQITFGRATGRYFGKIVSAVILYIGFIMAAFTDRKQALHDMMANTLVVRSE